MKYPAPTIANYFIKKAKECNQLLTPMKLIKLVYLAHGWCLGLQQTALIDEPVAAWRYGPVIYSLYHQFKKFSNDSITEYAPSSDHDLYNDQNTLALLDRVWEVYGKYTGIQLSTLTHEQDSPWDIAWNKQKGKDNYNHAISDQIIQEYYAEQAKLNTAM